MPRYSHSKTGKKQREAIDNALKNKFIIISFFKTYIFCIGTKFMKHVSMELTSELTNNKKDLPSIRYTKMISLIFAFAINYVQIETSLVDSTVSKHKNM